MSKQQIFGRHAWNFLIGNSRKHSSTLTAGEYVRRITRWVFWGMVLAAVIAASVSLPGSVMASTGITVSALVMFVAVALGAVGSLSLFDIWREYSMIHPLERFLEGMPPEINKTDNHGKSNGKWVRTRLAMRWLLSSLALAPILAVVTVATS